MTFKEPKLVPRDSVTDPSPYHRDIVEAHERLADAACDGHWTGFFAQLDEKKHQYSTWCVTANDSGWEAGAGFGPLHQAAWHVPTGRS